MGKVEMARLAWKYRRVIWKYRELYKYRGVVRRRKDILGAAITAVAIGAAAVERAKA